MKKIIVSFIFLVLLTTSACSNQTLNTPAHTPSNDVSTSKPASKSIPANKEISFEFLDTSMFPNIYLSDGEYRCGTDFDPGDYYILSLHGAEALYDVSNSPDNFSWSYHINTRLIHAKEGQFIKLGDAILIPYNELDTTDWTVYGSYLVGRDLPAGTYKAETLSNSYTNSTYGINISGPYASYQITQQSPVGNLIKASLLFDKQAYLELKEGQYITINNMRLTLSE